MPVQRRLFAQMRKVAGYSQEGLAERLGVDRTTVARWEAGETTPQPWQRPRIADAFGLSLSELAELLDNADATKYAGEGSASLAGTEGALLSGDGQVPAPAAAPRTIPPNEQLRAARERTASPTCPDECLTRQELAELVNAWIWKHHRKKVETSASYIGQLERGTIRWPGKLYREALR
jgi:transcriptional regulator with XRE-family HTH domain